MNQHERAYIRFRQALPMAKRHLFRGKWKTAQEIADQTGIKVRTVHRRIQYGLPIEGTARFGPAPRQFAFRGRLATAKEIMAETGLSRSQVGKRTDGQRFFERGESTDPYPSFPEGARVLFFEGISDTVSGWARRVGIPHYVIRERIDTMGWPIARALTRPPMDRGAQRRRNRRVVQRIATAIMRDRNTSIIQRIASATQTGGYRQTFDLTRRTGEDSSARDLHHEGMRA